MLKSELGEKKVYFIDNGLLNAIRAFDKSLYGALFENLIWCELINQCDKIIFFKEKRECDFVLDNKTAVQVCYDFSKENTRKREIDGLVECCRYFNFNKGFIVTYDDEDELTVDNVDIHIIPAYRLAISGSLLMTRQ